VKRWQIIALAVILALGIGYVILHPRQFGLAGPHATGADGNRNPVPAAPVLHPAKIEWQQVDRTSDGFRVEMPAGVKQIQIPAYTETGGIEQMNMIFSNPGAETAFSVTWQDNPAVARVSNRAPDRTLEMARDGAIARTQTTLVSDSATSTQGFPGRTFEAINNDGGVMNSRLIYAGSRLYMLIATFPSVSARRDRDVTLFFNSFTITSASGSTPAGGGNAQSQEPSKTD
jgi:hypothetical protein